MVALIAGIFGGVDPLLCLTRAGVALMGGCVLGALWQALLATPTGGSPAVAAPGANGTDAEASADA